MIRLKRVNASRVISFERLIVKKQIMNHNVNPNRAMERNTIRLSECGVHTMKIDAIHKTQEDTRELRVVTGELNFAVLNLADPH